MADVGDIVKLYLIECKINMRDDWNLNNNCISLYLLSTIIDISNCNNNNNLGSKISHCNEINGEIIKKWYYNFSKKDNTMEYKCI